MFVCCFIYVTCHLAASGYESPYVTEDMEVKRLESDKEEAT